jgi:hypothetical protein
MRIRSLIAGLLFPFLLPQSMMALEPPTLREAMLHQSVVDKQANITMGKLLVQARYEAKQIERWAIIRGQIQSLRSPLPEQKKEEELRARNDDFSQAIDAIPWVDMARVRTTWLSWYNDVRSDMGRSPYVYDSRLDDTARVWAQALKMRDERDASDVHKRSSWDSYYDYKKITDWFEDHGVVWVIRNRATTTENVWFWYYKCSQSDCTDELIDAIRGTFKFYMSEKATNGSHYRSIVQPNFTKIGLSIQVDASTNRFYLVVHYITDFE